MLKVCAVDKTRLKIGSSVLNEMGRIYGFKVVPEFAAGELLSIQVRWLTLGDEPKNQ